jgi:hypothetical protein
MAFEKWGLAITAIFSNHIRNEEYIRYSWEIHEGILSIDRHDLKFYFMGSSIG